MVAYFMNIELKKITILAIFVMSFISHAQFINPHWGSLNLIGPNGSKIDTSFAVRMSEKTKGLSGLEPSKMKDEQGLFFYYDRIAPMSFWMPNTHFNLDIVFINPDMQIVAVEENVKHHKGGPDTEGIPTTKTYKAQYVLELKAGQAKKYGIWPGKFLKWEKPELAKKLFLRFN